MLFYDIDKKFEEIGFVKVCETKSYVQYETQENWGTRCLDLLYKEIGEHLIQCYQKGNNENMFSRMSGINAKEAALAMKKMKRMGWN